ncbi:MAG: hypothetical protein ACE5OY_03115 [Candidatus Bathyarchaeia archaeon]
MTFEGNFTREKVVQLLDLVDLMGGTSKSEVRDNKSKFARVFQVIKDDFPFKWFSSKDVKRCYDREYGGEENIKLSTMSTYLSRLSSMGLLLKRGTRRVRRYRCIAPRRLLEG